MRNRIALLVGLLTLSTVASGDSAKGADYWNPPAKKVKKVVRSARSKPKKVEAKPGIPTVKAPEKPLVEWPLLIWETEEPPGQPASPETPPATLETAPVTRASVELALEQWLQLIFRRQPEVQARTTFDRLVHPVTGVRYSRAGTNASRQRIQDRFPKQPAQAFPAAVTLYAF